MEGVCVEGITKAYVYNNSSSVKSSTTVYVHVCTAQEKYGRKDHILLTAITLVETWMEDAWQRGWGTLYTLLHIQQACIIWVRILKLTIQI